MFPTAKWSGVDWRLAEQNPKAFLWRSRTNEWRAFKPRSIYFGQKNNFWTFQVQNLIRQIKSGQKSVKISFPVFTRKKNLRKRSEIKNFISVDEKNAHKCWSLKMRLFLSIFDPTLDFFMWLLKPGKCIRVKVKSESRCESARKEKREVAAQNPKPGI